MNNPQALMRELRSLDPINEPNTTWHIGQDGANLIEKLLAKNNELGRIADSRKVVIEGLEERLREAERLIAELDNHEGCEGWSFKLQADLMMFWASKNS